MSDPAGAPVRLEFTGPYEVNRWRPLLHWILAFPHYLVVWVLAILAGVCLFISFFAILFTRTIPPQLFDLLVMVLRYTWRVQTYVLWMREDYPPFDFTAGGADNGLDPPTRLEIDRQEELARFGPIYKWFLAIPHFIVLWILGIGAFFAALAAFFAVLFTGRYPEGIRNYLIGFQRWTLRVQAYAGFLRDEYPPFSLD
jgi:hypothetical protein